VNCVYIHFLSRSLGLYEKNGNDSILKVFIVKEDV